MSDLEYERRLWPRIKNAFRVLVAFTFSHVGVCGLVVGYMIFGAFLFQAIEEDVIDPKLGAIRQLRNDTAKQLLEFVIQFNVLDKRSFTERMNAVIENYTREIVFAINEGYEGEPKVNETSLRMNNLAGGGGGGGTGNPSWSFTGAFLYSLTVITTIGYGNVTPKKAWGKVATILYGIIGMPLFLLYLSNIGDILARGFKWTFARCCQCRWNCIKPRRYVESGEEDDEDEEDVVEEEEQITVPISLCLALMVGYVWGGGLLFSQWEGWEVLDASYFCFISLSTIGFGDFVPGDALNKDGSDELSFVFCSLYLLLGMALIAMCFQLMQEEVVATVRKIGTRLGCSRRK